MNTQREFPNHEVKHGAEANKRRGAPKRLGNINMRSTPIPRDVMVDEKMGFFGCTRSVKGCIGSFGNDGFQTSVTCPKGAMIPKVTFGVHIRA